MSGDSKVYAMIEELSRRSLLELLGSPCETAKRSYLTSAVRQQYEIGQINGDDIVATWEDDAE